MQSFQEKYVSELFSQTKGYMRSFVAIILIIDQPPKGLWFKIKLCILLDL